MLGEIILALLAAAGVFSLLWALLGWLLLSREGEQTVLLYADGEGQLLERQLRRHLWLCRTGLLQARLVVVDQGLTTEAAKLAKLLCRDCGAEYWRIQELHRLLDGDFNG